MFDAVNGSSRSGDRVARTAVYGVGRSGVARLLAVIAASAVALLASSASAAAAPRKPFVVPPVGGLYNGLAVAWWNYALGQPAATNPLTDASGVKLRTRPSWAGLLPGGNRGIRNRHTR